MSHIMSWEPDGRSFRVRDPSGFTDDFARRYFRCKANSVIRVLRIYQFRRTRHKRATGKVGPLGLPSMLVPSATVEEVEYQHYDFVRSMPHLCRRITTKWPETEARLKREREKEKEEREGAIVRDSEGDDGGAGNDSECTHAAPMDLTNDVNEVPPDEDDDGVHIDGKVET